MSPSEFLRHAHDFFGGGDAGADFQPAVFAQVAHAVAARGHGDLRSIGIRHDELADLVVQFHQLKDADAAVKTGARTTLASRAAESIYSLALGRDGRSRRSSAVVADH